MREEVPGLPSRTFPLVLAAPSGGGKTTVARLLRTRRDDVTFSISATTRPPRSHEMHGRDYWFVSGEDFRRMAEAGELVEWAEVHGNLYGTPRRNLHDAELRGEYLLLDVDIQGARQLRERVPDAVMVFILPPAGKTLGDRLSARGSEDRCELERRLSNARGEIAAARDFDYVVLNDDLEATVDRVEEILAAEAHRVSRLSTLDAEIERLGGEIGRYLAVGGAEAGHTLREKDPCE